MQNSKRAGFSSSSLKQLSAVISKTNIDEVKVLRAGGLVKHFCF